LDGHGGGREKTGAEKDRSGVAHLRGFYRYLNYGVAAPPDFKRRESNHGPSSSRGYTSGYPSAPTSLELV
jgi:hypothetical protein